KVLWLIVDYACNTLAFKLTQILCVPRGARGTGQGRTSSACAVRLQRGMGRGRMSVGEAADEQTRSAPEARTATATQEGGRLYAHERTSTAPWGRWLTSAPDGAHGVVPAASLR